tara:strand:+ start:1289 stop:2584 length:1296 start_codon:yes stop_codon:yes gene_type:complete
MFLFVNVTFTEKQGKFMYNIKKLIQEKTAEAPIKLFGLFGILNYPVFYIFWKIIPDSRYDDLVLRVIATFLCLGLFLKDKWPVSIKKILPYYWYASITFCLPFMGTYILLENQFSGSWILNSILGVFLLLFVLDWKSFSIVFPAGVILGGGFYFLKGNHIHIMNENVLSVILNTSWVVIVAMLFSRNKTILESEKQKTLTAQAGIIAHEMRTPLMNVTLCGNLVGRSVRNLKKMTPPKEEAEREVLKQDIEMLTEISGDLVEVARNANNVINLLLSNLKQDFSGMKVEPLSMKAILDETMRTYVFNEDGHKVNIDIQQDFTLVGNQELLIHVFFNLLKNSLYFIHAAGKGEVFISVETDDTHNIVIFKDTGPGIEKKYLQKLFTPFFSNSPKGTGIGLSFCKKVIESLKGSIKAESTYGEHTTFTMRFPKE